MGQRSVLHSVNVKTTAVFVADRAPKRDYHCPVHNCGRFLMASTATSGMARVKCESCKTWHWLRLGVDGRPSRG